MGAACGCHCWEKHYDSIYIVKRRQLERSDGATELYVEVNIKQTMEKSKLRVPCICPMLLKCLQVDTFLQVDGSYFVNPL